jgi:hypothetical protein
MSAQEKKSNGVAALLSLIIPGAGQMYKDKVGQGLLWLFCVVIGYGMLVLPGLILHLFCILSAASDDQSKTEEGKSKVLDAEEYKRRDEEYAKKSSVDVAIELKKVFDLKSRDLITEDEFVSSKAKLINTFCEMSSKPNKNDFLLTLVPLIDSGAISKDEVQQLKDSYLQAA